MPIPFSKIRFKNLETILKILKDTLAQLEIDFYLIGAVARDIQLTGKHDIKTPRATRDIDIAILVNNQDLYDKLVRDLMDHHGFEDGFKIRVSSLAGICLLKFFAWGDKLHSRERDINDIDFILSKYTDIYIDEIFDKHSDLLKEGWSDFLGSRILGRHIGSILMKNGESRNKLTALLSDQLTEDSMLPQLFTRFNKKTISDNINLIRDIITGVNE